MADNSFRRWRIRFSVILLLMYQVTASVPNKALSPEGRLAKVTMVFSTESSESSYSSGSESSTSAILEDTSQISPTTSLPASSEYFTVLDHYDTSNDQVDSIAQVSLIETSQIEPMEITTTTSSSVNTEFPYSLLIAILNSQSSNDILPSGTTISTTPVFPWKTVPTVFSFYTLPHTKIAPTAVRPSQFEPSTVVAPSTEGTISTNDPDVSSLLGDISLALGSFRPLGSNLDKRPANATDPQAVDKIIADLMSILRPAATGSTPQVAIATPSLSIMAPDKTTLGTLQRPTIRPTVTRKPLRTAFRPIRPSVSVSSPSRFPLRRRPLLTVYRPSQTTSSIISLTASRPSHSTPSILPTISSEYAVLNAIKEIQTAQLANPIISATSSKTSQILPTYDVLQSLIDAHKASVAETETSSTLPVIPAINEVAATPEEDLELRPDIGDHEEVAPFDMETNYWQEKDVVLNKVRFTLKPLVTNPTPESPPVENFQPNDEEINGLVPDIQHGLPEETTTSASTTTTSSTTSFKPGFIAFGSANPVAVDIHSDDAHVPGKLPENLHVGGEIQVFGDVAVGSGSLVVKQKTTTPKPVILLVGTKGTTATTPLTITPPSTSSPPAEVAALPLEIDERPLQQSHDEEQSFSATVLPDPTKSSTVVTQTIFNTVVSVSSAADEDHEETVIEHAPPATESEVSTTTLTTTSPTSTTTKVTSSTTTANRRRTRRPTRSTTPLPIGSSSSRRPLRRPTTRPTTTTTRPAIRVPSALGLGLSLLPVAVIATVLGIPFVIAAAGRKKRQVEEDASKQDKIDSLHSTFHKSLYNVPTKYESHARRRR